MATIFRIHTLYRPLKTFFFLGALLLGAGVMLGVRFLYYYFGASPGGHVQSLILAAVLVLGGFQTMLIGLIADLISVNRRLSEDVLIRIRKMEPVKRLEGRVSHRLPRQEQVRYEQPRHHLPEKAGAPGERPSSKWVWLTDEDKIEQRSPSGAGDLATTDETKQRKRRRRRRSARSEGSSAPQQSERSTSDSKDTAGTE